MSGLPQARGLAYPWADLAAHLPHGALRGGTAQSAILARMARLKLTLTMESGARIGPGKAALLESVRSSGSISAAARTMGMDYKRAWLLVDSLNRAFDTPVVERVTGGSGGGGAILTPFGKDLLARYRKLEARAAKMAAADLKAIEKHAVPDPGPKV
jgi:molybdate transport system regulatory protein